MLSGLGGGLTSVIANCFSFVSASSRTEERTLRCSAVEAMQHLAATAGPFLSNLLKQSISPLAVFIGDYQTSLRICRPNSKHSFYFPGWSVKFVDKPVLLFVAASGCCHLLTILYCLTLEEPRRTGPRPAPTCTRLFSPSHILDSVRTVATPRPGQ